MTTTDGPTPEAVLARLDVFAATLEAELDTTHVDSIAVRRLRR